MLLILAFIGLNFHAQTKTERLQKRLAISGKNQFQRIRIEFDENVNCRYWNQEFYQQKVPVNQRPTLIIEKLQSQAEASQSGLLEKFMKDWRKDVKNVQPFWIVNMIVLEAKPVIIDLIAQMDGVALVDLEETKIQMNEYFPTEIPMPKAIGAAEPGLVAINAPALWAMGYTGRGTVVYDYDTGVWPDHPAFSDRFMANFFPMEQSWLGYYKDFPTGVYNSHGTHTLGTMAGLDTATNDTIGCAFESYWIACDHIRSSVAELPPITDMVLAFEWALDPDGDPGTTYDVPHVINNSWRWYDDADTLYCSGFVVNLMNAIEAAGIANVFSGGNFGPSNTTISSPQRINTSDVNTFSVGSVDGNSSFPYPISTFSSIGPKQCPGSGSLAIHPEVVAPGQNVRSAWGRDGYNSISGTSMAAPHVSGACLLLKEAFPMATGEEILRALYLTAVDLGAAGEDNTYGMGIIDCLAAFNHLALTYTPENPNAIAWDLAIVKVNNPDDDLVTCTGTFNPTVTLMNQGDSTITNISIFDTIAGYSNTINWTGTLLPGQQAVVSLAPLSISSQGELEYLVVATINHAGANDIDLYNDRRINRFTIRPEHTVPYLEKFENGFGDDWMVENADDGLSWEIDTTAGLPWNVQSATLQHFWYTPVVNQEDELIGPNISTAALANLFFKFDRAYEDRNSAGRQDSLIIYLSTDCGQTWPYQIYKNWGVNMATIDTINISFVPSQPHHWVSDSIDLSAYLAHSELMVKFVSKNRNGQNVWIDNVRFYESVDPATVEGLNSNQVKIYPNPTNDVVVVNRYNTANCNVKIYNSSGQIVYFTEMQENQLTIDVGHLAPGIYTIDVQGTQTMLVVK